MIGLFLKKHYLWHTSLMEKIGNIPYPEEEPGAAEIMGNFPHEGKFNQRELESLRMKLAQNLSLRHQTEMIADFLAVTGYGANYRTINENLSKLTKGISKASPEEFKKILEGMALEN
jgi:hypothetical protein